ncbi:hypothetical protein M9H77_08587 [Catharanthus roseus]|uniref:Uncharacterized protein n=1 Tax=Catharanthus roseus TaxID=4058 RepID=A0ACC0BYF9_CATRO|nr:hypothetical protein M9H77_08587 [Catharanthus roseus]
MVTVVMMITMTVMMMEMRSSPYMLHLWHQLVDRKGVLSRNKRPDVARDVPAPMEKRKKVKPSDWEQIEAAEGGPVDPELIPSYGGHVAGRIWHGQVFIFMIVSHQVRAACYLQYILDSSLFSDRSGSIVPARLWPLLRDVSRVGRFAWGATCLAYLYRNLGQTSRADAKELAGCRSLLESNEYRSQRPIHIRNKRQDSG